MENEQSESNEVSDEGQLPIVLEPFMETGTREHKFLTVRQILRKVDPKWTGDEAAVWSFQKNSWSFPTMIVVKRCLSATECRHKIILYFGADIDIISAPREEIVSMLQHQDYNVPGHFQPVYVAEDV